MNIEISERLAAYLRSWFGRFHPGTRRRPSYAVERHTNSSSASLPTPDQTLEEAITASCRRYLRAEKDDKAFGSAGAAMPAFRRGLPTPLRPSTCSRQKLAYQPA